MVRRVMDRFRIDEISSVDRPAQEHAKMILMKRDSGGDPGEAEHGQPPGNLGAAMSNAIKKALGLADTATDTEVEAAIVKLASGELKEAATKLEKAETDLKVAKAKAAMTDKEKAFMDGKDDEAVCKFMDLSSDARASEIAKHAAGDETVEIEGRTISKRAVGEDVFAVMKAQAKRISDNEAAITKANDDRDNATFAKRASDEFGHLAGTPEDRMLVLKAIAKLDDTARKAAEAILKAAEGHAKFAFSRAGHGGGANPVEGETAEAKLNKMAKEVFEKSAGALTFAKAYDQVAQANPSLYQEVVNPEE